MSGLCPDGWAIRHGVRNQTNPWCRKGHGFLLLFDLGASGLLPETILSRPTASETDDREGPHPRCHSGVHQSGQSGLRHCRLMTRQPMVVSSRASAVGFQYNEARAACAFDAAGAGQGHLPDQMAGMAEITASIDPQRRVTDHRSWHHPAPQAGAQSGLCGRPFDRCQPACRADASRRRGRQELRVSLWTQ